MTCCIGMDFFPTNFMLQNPHHLEDDDHQPSSLFPSSTPLQNFYGSFLGKRSCDEAVSHGDNGLVSDEEDEEGSIEDQKIKKRRLNREQVKALEKSFEVGNKLEPERKMELARALGLEPRQIAIWFQNRRARWKTKQLERDYESLKNQFDSLKAENDALLSHNQNLHAQIMALKNNKDSIQPTESINLNKETEGSCSNSSEIKLDVSRSTPAIDSHPTTRSPLFPPPTMRPAAGMAHLLHSSTSRPSDLVHYQCLKMGPTAKEETLSNMFCGNDDQSGFWPWLDQQHFN